MLLGMSAVKLQANVVTCNAGISACAGVGWEWSLELLASMQGTQVKADVISFSAQPSWPSLLNSKVSYYCS